MLLQLRKMEDKFMSGTGKKTIVEFRDVVKTYGEGEALQYANNHVSFTIEEGEFVVILGQSGAGKSTVLNMLGGMDLPTSGKVLIDGEEVSAMNDKQLSDFRARKIGFIFQFYNLIPSLTVRENVALTKSIVKDAADPDEMLAAVGLANHKNKFPSQLSGGEQQRVSIARAIVNRPPLLICDEPTGNLDPQNSRGIMDLLERINRTGTTVLVATHDREMVDNMRRRVIALDKGVLTRDQDRGVYGFDV